MSRRPPVLSRLPVAPANAPGALEGDPLVHVLATEARLDALLQEASAAAEVTIARAHQRIAELEAAAPELLARDLAALEAAAVAESRSAVARIADELREQAARFDAVDDATCDRLGRWALRMAAGAEEPLPDHSKVVGIP